MTLSSARLEKGGIYHVASNRKQRKAAGKVAAFWEALIDAAAELYYLQRELNRKIGRTVYHKGSIDRTLLRHIYNEITARLPEPGSYPCDEG